MIKISMNGEKWRIGIGGGSNDGEVWEFETRNDMEDCLSVLLDYKEENGKLRDFGR